MLNYQQFRDWIIGIQLNDCPFLNIWSPRFPHIDVRWLSIAGCERTLSVISDFKLMWLAYFFQMYLKLACSTHPLILSSMTSLGIFVFPSQSYLTGYYTIGLLEWIECLLIHMTQYWTIISYRAVTWSEQTGNNRLFWNYSEESYQLSGKVPSSAIQWPFMIYW